MNNVNELMNATNFVIILFGFSSMVWMGEVSMYFAINYPRFVTLGTLPVFVFMISTAEYILLTYARYLPSGFSTFIFSLDNALGMILVALLTLICAFYLLYPFLKMGRDLLPKQVAQEVSIFKSPPIKGIGATYIYVSFVVVSLCGVLILSPLNQFLFGVCSEPVGALCARFSVFTVRFANYISVNISLNEVVAQIVVATGALTAMLGVVKASIDIYKAMKENRKEQDIDKGVKEKAQSNGAPKTKKKA